MKKILKILKVAFFLISPIFISYAQISGGIAPDELRVYPYPPLGTAYNSDFEVEVKQGFGSWKSLFEYKTFVHTGPYKSDFVASSFVQFDFSGSVDIKVTCNYCTSINSTIIRPQSSGITPYSISNKTAYFKLTEPANLSFEVNGDRYRNLQIFASTLDEIPAGQITDANDINAAPGDVYNATSGETIYLAGGTVINKSIKIRSVNNVKVLGRGVIDFTSKIKSYHIDSIPADYQYLRGVNIYFSDSIDVSGIIINDPQQYGVGITKSENITIKDIKIFTRVLWGDGIQMIASSNVNIDSSYIRTSDDSVSLYPSRQESGFWYRGSAENITLTNSSLYPDSGRPIQIGTHGSLDPLDRDWIRNINYSNLDLLSNRTTSGSIGLNCSDENRCRDLTFSNINIEDIESGRMFEIIVRDTSAVNSLGPGYRMDNVIFDSITYTGGMDHNRHFLSILRGISCWRYVNGVHFNNLIVNGNPITSINDPDFNASTNGVNRFSVEGFVYDISFNNIPVNSVVNNGTYKIENKLESKSLMKSIQQNSQIPSALHVIAAPFNSSWQTQKWEIKKENDGYYSIKDLRDGDYLQSYELASQSNIGCLGRYTLAEPSSLNNEQFKWEIVDVGNGYVRFKNLADANSLTQSDQNYNGSSWSKYIITQPWEGLDSQKWKLTLQRTPKSGSRAGLETNKAVFWYPNPANKEIVIDFTNSLNDLNTVHIYDMFAQLILVKELSSNEETIDISDMPNGLYILSYFDGDEIVREQLIVKH